nr:FAD:protein FMN transferase [Robertkochia marina]
MRLRTSLFSVLIILLVVTSCGIPGNEPYQQSEKGRALGTTYTIIYDVPDEDVSYHEEILAVFDTVNASMSTYIPNSDISRVNRGEADVVVDDYFKEVFLKSKEVWRQTNRAFDPTVGALVNAWGFGPEEGLGDLDSTQVDSILQFTGLEKVFIDSLNRVVKAHPQVYLDFNALAKGYCIDLIGRMLEEKGVENYLVEVGGEILCKGSNTRRVKNWVVAIDNPLQGEKDRLLISKIKLVDRAMATSGNYRKYRVDETTGEKYVHTIDPRTGYPFKNNVLSTSVIASTCMEADAYATAFMLMPLDSIRSSLRELPGLEAYVIAVDDKGDLVEFRTDGFEDLVIEEEQ